jgi:hypothetical protein
MAFSNTGLYQKRWAHFTGFVWLFGISLITEVPKDPFVSKKEQGLWIGKPAAGPKPLFRQAPLSILLNKSQQIFSAGWFLRDRVSQRPQAFDVYFDDIAWADRTDARRRSGKQEIARQDGHDRRDIGN